MNLKLPHFLFNKNANILQSLRNNNSCQVQETQQSYTPLNASLSESKYDPVQTQMRGDEAIALPVNDQALSQSNQLVQNNTGNLMHFDLIFLIHYQTIMKIRVPRSHYTLSNLYI